MISKSEFKQPKDLTLRVVLISILLAVLLAAANAYLGLKIGLTISACIPAAVISMSILKVLKNESIFESNLIQTAASAGEALSAGVVFVMPALILGNYWEDFYYLQTFAISLLGGLLGVFFTIPLKKFLIIDTPELVFPEGKATADILKAGSEKQDKLLLKQISFATLLAAIVKLSQTGLKIISSYSCGAFSQGRALFSFGLDYSLSLLSIGYIIGTRISICIFFGSFIAWLIGIPVYTTLFGLDLSTSSLYKEAYNIWLYKIRFLGVGAMIVGGIQVLVPIFRCVFNAYQKLKLSRLSKSNNQNSSSREKDIPNKIIVLGVSVIAVLLVFVFTSLVDSKELSVNKLNYYFIITFAVAFCLIGGFIFSAISAYMSGLVGSSNNPVSSIAANTILISSLVLFSLLGIKNDFIFKQSQINLIGAIVLTIGSIICCTSAIAGDNMQDLKTGHLIGASPCKQQILQIIGVVSSATLIAPLLKLLNNAYGFGGSEPDSLTAPKALLMKSLFESVFSQDIEWELILIGALIAISMIVVNFFLEKFQIKLKISVLALGLGLYLPLKMTSTILIGGLIFYFSKQPKISKRALLLTSGLITGEALMGILLAVPFALLGNRNILTLNLFNEGSFWLKNSLGFLVFISVSVFLYQISKFKKNNQKNRKLFLLK